MKTFSAGTSSIVDKSDMSTTVGACLSIVVGDRRAGASKMFEGREAKRRCLKLQWALTSSITEAEGVAGMFSMANEGKDARSSIVGKGNSGSVGCGAVGVSRKLVVDCDSA